MQSAATISRAITGAERLTTANLTDRAAGAVDNRRRGWQLARNVWADMAVMFGDKWTKKHGREPCPVWATALQDLDGQTVQSVFLLLREDGAVWPPELADYMVLVDRVLARRYQLPDADDALLAAREGDWSCAAVYEASRRIGIGRVTGSAWTAADGSRALAQKWTATWRAVVREVTAGKVFNAPVLLPPPEKVVVTAEHRARAKPLVDALKARLGPATHRGGALQPWVLSKRVLQAPPEAELIAYGTFYRWVVVGTDRKRVLQHWAGGQWVRAPLQMLPRAARSIPDAAGLERLARLFFYLSLGSACDACGGEVRFVHSRACVRCAGDAGLVVEASSC